MRLKGHNPGYYPGRVDAFLPSETWRHSGDRPDDGKQVARQVIEHVGPYVVDGDNMLREPRVGALAARLNQGLRYDPGDSMQVADQIDRRAGTTRPVFADELVLVCPPR